MKLAKLVAMTVLSYLLSAGVVFFVFVFGHWDYFETFILAILAWIPLVVAGILEYRKKALWMLLGFPFVAFYLFIIFTFSKV